MKHVWGRGELPTRFWWGNLRHEGYLEDLSTDGRIILKCLLKKKGWLELN
jgi:hypothetical protein